MSFGSSRFLLLTLTARGFDKSRNDVHKADENYYPFWMDSWLLKHSEGDKKTERKYGGNVKMYPFLHILATGS